MLILSTMPAGVAAQQSDSGPLGVFDDSAAENDSFGPDMGAVAASAKAGFERIQYAVATRVTDNIPDFVAEKVPFASADDDATVDDHAQSIKHEVNPHNDTITTYINEHVNETNKSAYDIVKLNLEDQEGNERSVYAVTTLNDTTGNATDIQVVNSTNATVDYTLDLSAFASSELSEDVEWARENYVAENQAPDGEIRGRFTAKYAGGHIEVHEGDA